VPTIREAVDALEERLFVGRARDLEGFRTWLEGDAEAEFSLLNVHGPGGVGKSALLGAFRRIAERAGRPVALVDGRSVPPEPGAFLEAASAGTTGRANASAVTARLAAINRRKPLLLVDAFEELEELTRWLQEEFLPELDTGVRVVIAGRFPLGSAWSDWQKIDRKSVV